MISSDVMRGYNDTIILSLLQQADSYGYEISKQIRDITKGEYVIKETTLYSAFSRLEKSGFITSYEGGETHGKPRTYFRITPTGAAYLKEKCEEWQITEFVINQFVKEYLTDGND